jgi:hypothetical protein
MKEAPGSSETSALTRATRRNNPEDTIVHSHRRENLKSYGYRIVYVRGWVCRLQLLLGLVNSIFLGSSFAVFVAIFSFPNFEDPLARRATFLYVSPTAMGNPNYTQRQWVAYKFKLKVKVILTNSELASLSSCQATIWNMWQIILFVFLKIICRQLRVCLFNCSILGDAGSQPAAAAGSGGIARTSLMSALATTILQWWHFSWYSPREIASTLLFPP